jgi:hypothetical protein
VQWPWPGRECPLHEEKDLKAAGEVELAGECKADLERTGEDDAVLLDSRV